MPVLTIAAAMFSMGLCVGTRIPQLCVREGTTLAGFEDEARRLVARYDQLGDGFDEGDIELVSQRQRASSRDSRLSGLVRYDLDGDFALDEAEIERADPNRAGERGADERRRLIRRYDLNGDDRIDRGEMLDRPQEGHELRLLQDLRTLLALETSGDGRLEPDELVALARQVFGEFDVDRDGIVSSADLEADLRRRRDERRPRNICAVGSLPFAASDFGVAGLRGAYSFVTDGAGDAEMGVFLRGLEEAGFNVVPLTANLAGYDTLFAFGPASLRSSADVQREYTTACALAPGGGIFLTEVRHNPADQTDPVRVR